MTVMPDTGHAKRKKATSLSEFLCRESVAGYMFISLFIIGFLVFTIIPMIASLYLSFTNYNILGDAKWIGFANYVKMFTRDSKYLKSLSVTFFYAFVSVPLKLLMALIVAMIMTHQSRLTGFFRLLSSLHYWRQCCCRRYVEAAFFIRRRDQLGPSGPEHQLDQVMDWKQGHCDLGSDSADSLAVRIFHADFSCRSQADSPDLL